MNKIRYFKRPHRRLLTESLEEIKEITPEEFSKQLQKENIQYYAYDERINQHIYLHKSKFEMYCIGTKRDIETYLNENENS